MTERDTDAESDIDLVRRAQAEDIDAFCLLAERYARRIYLLASHYCRNTQDAEDLSQEVWLKAYLAVQTFRFDSSFYTWLRRITINAFLNHRRASFFRSHGQTTAVQLLQIDSEEQQALFVSSTRAQENIYNKLLFENVVNALAELTPGQRLAFLLRHYEGMSYDEIATAMNCSAGTVKKGVWRAIGKLRARLSPESDPQETLTSLASEY
ncbi:MAG TPA: sigma-70 family RNA polymerase sigma factor [Pyrinomonadaceae bacterium]|nr:sigma-70 family RNA polymerase sigma factor [Pyrinomonadaceae bacterium]